jgi:TolA-binding protein
MNNQEKIAALLLKENLSEEEKLLLEKLAEEDEDAAKFINTYKKLNKFVNNSSHLSFEEISDYILIKNNLSPEDQNIIKLVPKIEDHLRNCSKCTEEFKLLNAEFSSIETFVGQELNKEEKVNAPAHLTGKRKINFYRYAFLSLIILGMLYGMMFTVSKLSAPKYYDLASINSKPDFYTTRGRATNDFLKSLNALDEGDVNKAIVCLKDDIKKNPDDKTIFYSYYILGLTYLDNSGKNILGLFPHYDSYSAEQAAKNFQTAMDKNNSGNYRNITLDACFYLAKSNIMLNKLKDAKEELTMVIKEKGSKMEEAEKILNALE